MWFCSGPLGGSHALAPLNFITPDGLRLCESSIFSSPFPRLGTDSLQIAAEHHPVSPV